MDSAGAMRQLHENNNWCYGDAINAETAGDGGCEAPGGLPFYAGSWAARGGDELCLDAQDELLHLCWTAEGSADQTPSCRLDYAAHLEEEHNLAGQSLTCPVAPLAPRPCSVTPVATSDTPLSSALSSVAAACGPVGFSCVPAAAAWDALTPTHRSPGCSDGGPVSAAAHLHLLGESLSLIGRHLQETDKALCASSSLSLLLDSLLCALAPLVSLTAQIPELRSCSQHSLAVTLENIAYLMPGL